MIEPLVRPKAYERPKDFDIHGPEFDHYLYQLYGDTQPVYLETDAKFQSDSKFSALFKAQLKPLQGKYIQVITRLQKDDNVIEILSIMGSFIKIFDQLKDPAFYNRDTQFYNGCKHAFEKILFILDHTDNHQILEKTIKRIQEEIELCGPGLFTYLNAIVYEFINKPNITHWLARLRKKILDELVGLHILDYQIPDNNNIHVDFRFHQISEKLGLGIPLADNFKGIKDIIADRWLNISEGTESSIKRGFKKRYTYQKLIEEVTAQLSKLIAPHLDEDLSDQNKLKLFEIIIRPFIDYEICSSADCLEYDVSTGNVHIKENFCKEVLPKYCEKLLICEGIIHDREKVIQKIDAQPKLLIEAFEKRYMDVVYAYIDANKETGANYALSQLCNVSLNLSFYHMHEITRSLIELGAIIDPESLLAVPNRYGGWRNVLFCLKLAKPHQLKKITRRCGDLLCLAALSKEADASKVVDLLLDKFHVNPNVLTTEESPFILQPRDTCIVTDTFNDPYRALILERAGEQVKVHYLGWHRKKDEWISLAKPLMCSHYLMSNMPDDLEKHRHNRDILVVRDENNVYKIYCVLQDKWRYDLENPIVINNKTENEDDKVFKDLLNSMRQLAWFSEEPKLCEDSNFIKLVNQLVASKGGYIQRPKRFHNLPRTSGPSLLEKILKTRYDGRVARKLVANGARISPQQFKDDPQLLVNAAEKGLWDIVRPYINNLRNEIPEDILNQIHDIAIYNREIKFAALINERKNKSTSSKEITPSFQRTQCWHPASSSNTSTSADSSYHQNECVVEVNQLREKLISQDPIICCSFSNCTIGTLTLGGGTLIAVGTLALFGLGPFTIISTPIAVACISVGGISLLPAVGKMVKRCCSPNATTSQPASPSLPTSPHSQSRYTLFSESGRQSAKPSSLPVDYHPAGLMTR